MPDDDSADLDYLTPEDLVRWAQQELRDSAKAHELRVKGAFEIATAYASGRLSPQEAQARFLQHFDRWAEAIPGGHMFEGSTDNQVLTIIDEARASNRRIRGPSR